MHKNTTRIIIALSLIILLSAILSACRSAEPELDIDAQKTGFAQTADVQATLTSAAMPTPTETPEPTQTFTPTLEPTQTPIITPTETQGGAPPTSGTNRAQLIAQTPADNTSFQPGEAFTVTWTFENTGTSTWSINYYIDHTFGQQMGAEDKVFLWLPVPPETSLPISVDLIAPETPGTHVSNWKLFDAADNAFYDFSLTIVVAE